MKRITSSLLALLLALSMLIGMVPAALAVDAADTTESIDSTKTVDSSETEDVLDEAEEVAAQAADEENSEPQTLAEMVYAASEGDTITLPAGTYVIPSGVETGKAVPTGLTISGATDGKTTVVIQGITSGESSGTYFFDGQKTVTFKNLTIDFGPATDYDGFVRAGDMTFENVTIKGMGSHWGKGAVKFTKCSFVYPDEGYNEWTYNLWTYSGSSFEFKDCNFSAKLGGGNETNPARGKFVNVYSQATEGTVSVSLDTCKFKTEKEDGTTVTANKPILKIGNGSAWNISMTNIDITEAEAATDETTGSKLYGSSSGEGILRTDSTSVTINGTTDWKNGAKAEPTGVAKIGDTAYETLDAAITAVNDGETIIVNAGEYKLNGNLNYTGKAFTIKAADGAKVSFDMSAAVALHGAKITFENVTFDYKTNGNYIGMQHTDTLVYNKCTINGKAFLYATNETFNNCTFNQTAEDYNVWTYGAKNVAFNSCIFNCKGKAVHAYIEAGNASKEPQTIEVTDVTVNSEKPGKAFLNIKNSKKAYNVSFSGNNTVTGLVADGTTGSNLYQVDQPTITATSGNPVTIKETAADGTEKVIYEVKADTVPSGYVEDENGNVSISDADGLFWLAKQVNENGNTFAGKTVVLAADIDLKNAAWTPIGTSTNQFKGTFDGQNKTISNISANCPSMENVGLFGFATNCTLKNVTLENVDIKGKKNVGGLAGTVFAGSTVENVTVKGNIKISASVQYVGGIAGGYSYAKYVNCKVIGDGADSSYIQDTLVGDYTNYAGGIVGLYGEGAAGITGCEVSDITIRTVGYGAGGITGVLQYNNRVSDCKVKNVVIDSQPADSNGWAGTLAGKDYTSNGSNTSWLINNTIENTVIKVGGVEIANQYMGDDHTGTYPPHEEYEANAIIGTDVEYDESGKITAGTFITVGAKARETLESSISDSKSLSKGSDDTYNVTEKKAYVAEINGTGYETLAEAAKAAAAGDTITLLSDIKLTSVQTISKKLTLDLNGKTLDSTAYRTIQLNFGADLTVQDSGGTGKIANSYNGSTYPSTVYLNAKDTVFTLVSGTIESDPYKTSLQSVAINSEKDKACTVNIQGGSVVVPAAAKEGRAIVASTNSMTLNIKGGTITGGLHGIDAYSGSTVNITGGKVTATYVDTGVIKEAYGMRIKGTANVTINGGEIQGIKMDDDGYKLDVPNVTLVSGKVNGSFYSITKGTIVFTVDPTATITFENDTVKNFLPSTVELVRNEDGTYGVTKKVTYVAEVNGTKYETLQAAIDAAKSGTVKLIADTKENVTISKALTLDLNGYTLNGGTEKGKPALTITARTVTIKDSSAAQTGTIMREDTAENSGVSSHYVIDIQGNAWVMFESGNVKNNSGNASGKGASLVRVGDDSVAKYPGLNIKGGTFTQDNFIVIKVDRGDLFLNGGTLNCANSYAIEDWHRATIKGGTVNGAVAAWTYSGGLNSDLTISGGTINGDVTSVNYGNAEGRTAKVSITGGRVTGELDTRSYNPATSELTSIDDATKATIGVTGGTFDKNPMKYVVEGSTVKENGDGTFGVEKAYLAKVGETSYYTMDEAFKAQTASGEPIILLRDYTTGSPFNSGTINRTVDLNGHTWTCTGTDANSAAFEINNPNVTLTVKNGKIVSSQLVGLIPSAMGGTIKYDNSGLVFEGVEMSTTATSGIETNGNNTNDSVTLRNSTLNVPNGFGIYFPSSGTLTIDNSTINAKTMGVQVCAGSLSINEGSAITVTGDAVPKTENDGAIQDGAAISIVNRTGYKGLDTITVTGGTFTAKTGNAAIKAYDWANKTPADFTASDKVAVSGGTFSAEVPADLCAPGYVPVENSDGTYGVKEGTYVAAIGEKKYATLKEAVDAAKDGDTITLLANVTENVEISKGKRVTLDLNGYTLNGGTGTAKAALTNYGTITIKDSSAAMTGTIKRDDNGTVGETSYYVIRNQGTMTIESGTVINNSGYRKANSTGSMVGSSLICNGDCDEGGTLTINGGTFTQNNFIAIKNGALGVLYVTGGTITSNHSAIQNWFKADITGGEIKGQLWTDAWKEGESVGATQIGGDAKFTGEIVMDITGSVAPTLAINGGNLNVTNWRITSAAANAGAKPAVSGGTFSSAVKEEYCAPGFIPTKNEDGTYGVKEGTYVAETGGVKYESLQAAIDAAKSKAVVTMLADTRENVTISKALTLDLNGFTLNGGTVKASPALKVDNASVTVKDSSKAQTGTIMREDTAENSGKTSHYVIDIQGKYGFLKFEGGNVVNNSGNDAAKGASLVRLGDDSNMNANPTLTIKGGTFTQDNFIAIKVDRGTLHFLDGEVNSANSYAIENWNNAYIKGGTVNGTVSSWVYSTGAAFSKLEISGGTVNGNVASVNYDSAADKQARIYITGGHVTGTLGTYTYSNGLVPTEETAMATVEVTGGTFDKDPTKYVVEGSTVKTNGDGTFGVEKAYLAKIGDKTYYTMDEAFHAVTEGQTIVLLRDYTTASSQNSGSKSFTFDLNGFTWTYTGTDVNSAAFEINYSDVTLTVKNGKVESASMLGLIPTAMDGTIKYPNSGLVFDNVIATANGHSGIETNGGNENDTVTLKNSTLNVPNGFGIYFPSSGTLTIDNSKINAKTMGVQVCAGSLSINEGSAITVTDGPVDKTENDGAIEDGAAISIVNRKGYKGLGTITVTGGTFTAKDDNAAIKAYDWANNTATDFTEPTKVEVSGGTFSAPVPEDLCAVGYEPTEKDPSTGMYTVQEVSGNAYYTNDNNEVVYGDFAALVASTNTATKGKTITLLKDVKIEDNLVLFGNRTVDLNGNVLEITEIFIGLYGKVIDSSDGNGLLKIAADNVTLQSDNGLLPIYDSAKGGYRLFSFTMREQVTKPSDTTVKFKFGPIFENKEAYKLLLTGNNHNIKVTVTLKWISGDGRTGEQTFTFPQNLINGIGAAEGGSGFVINLTGFDSDITGSVSNVTAQWAISSGTGASVSGTPSVIYE